MPLTFRLRYSGGQTTLSGVPDATTIGELKELIAEKTGVTAKRQFLKAGFPPAPLPEADATQSLAASGVRDRDTLVVEEREPPPETADAKVASSPAEGYLAGAAPATSSAASLSPAAAALRSRLPPVPASDKVGDMSRHVIAADNSCLFNSVGYLLQLPDAAPTSPAAYRCLVADQISQDPERWDHITLAESSKPSLEYADWIKRTDSWGGSLELIVLAEQLGVQLSAICIRSLRVEHFPHEAPHKHRAYLLYDGIHYDAIVAKADGTGSEVRLFDPADEMTLNKVVALAIELKEQKQFTDTANFTLQCQHCFKLLRGETDAQQHGKETGHFNFQEVH